jgi:predicted RND superfamily exporter protein
VIEVLSKWGIGMVFLLVLTVVGALPLQALPQTLQSEAEWCAHLNKLDREAEEIRVQIRTQTYIMTTVVLASCVGVWYMMTSIPDLSDVPAFFAVSVAVGLAGVVTLAATLIRLYKQLAEVELQRLEWESKGATRGWIRP